MAGTTTGAAPGNDRLGSAPTEYTRDPGRRPVTSPEAALRRMLSSARPVTESERVATLAALARVLAETQYSTIQVPPRNNSAMDGYVVVAGDIPPQSETRLPIVQRIAAGYSGARLRRGTAARIFTGGAIPEGGDAVVMQERCRVEDGRVCIRGPVEPGEHVRRAGEDIARGERILESRAAGQSGCRLRHLLPVRAAVHPAIAGDRKRDADSGARAPSVHLCDPR